MKHLILIALAGLLLASCTKSIEERYTALLNDYTEAVRAAKTTDDMSKVTAEYTKKLDEFEKKNADELKKLEADTARQNEVRAAFQQLYSTTIQKSIELAAGNN